MKYKITFQVSSLPSRYAIMTAEQVSSVSKDPSAASTNHHLGMLDSTMILHNL
jgi:hypothetical protein